MRICVLSDVHGNLAALEAVLADARGEGAEA
jgi:predicted phosphodiesterase